VSARDQALYARTLSAADNLDGLPSALISDNKALPILINCCQLCRHNLLTIENARTPVAEYAQFYQDKFVEFHDRLHPSQRDSRSLLLRDTDLLRLALSTESLEAALVSAAALLAALSVYISRLLGVTEAVVASGAEFGGEEFRVFRRPENLILRRWPPGKRRPRLEHEVARTVESYHPNLCIEPTAIGGRRLVRLTLPSTIEDLFRRRLASGSVRIAVSHLTPAAEIRGEAQPGFPDSEPARFHLTTTGDEDSQQQALTEILQRCRTERIAVLVLPELRITPALLRVLRNFLRSQTPEDLLAGQGLLLVAGGSWHVIDDGGVIVNRCEVLDASGEPAWAHDKLAAYVITPDNLESMPKLREWLGLNNHGGIEGIHLGEQLEYCDSPVGRIAVAICVGFFHQPLRDLLVASRANLFLVPAMTPDLEPLEDRAKDLVRSQHAATFVANCGAVAGLARTSAGFYHTPLARRPTQMQDGWVVFELPQLTDS